MMQLCYETMTISHYEAVLFVDGAYRRKGIGRALAGRALDSLRAQGIGKCHLFLFRQNEEGRAFWRRCGFALREDIEILSIPL